MQRRYFLSLLVIPAIILVTRFVDMSTSASTAQRNFVAQISGDQIVPAVTTQSRGVAAFQLSADGKELSYTINVANIEHVTHMHLHLGQSGENGPPIAPLHAHDHHAMHGNSVNAQGVIRAADLMGPFAGSATLVPLLDAMAHGRAYANVHTETHPQGEVRGQVNISPAQ